MAFKSNLVTLSWKGKSYTLSYKGFEKLTGIPYKVIYYRHCRYLLGKMDMEYIFHVGRLPRNAVFYSPRKLVVEYKPDYSWLLRKERWDTVKLKWLYLDVVPSEYMNRVGQ